MFVCRLWSLTFVKWHAHMILKFYVRFWQLTRRVQKFLKWSSKLDNIIVFSRVFGNSVIIHCPITDNISQVKTKGKFLFSSADFLPRGRHWSLVGSFILAIKRYCLVFVMFAFFQLFVMRFTSKFRRSFWCGELKIR